MTNSASSEIAQVACQTYKINIYKDAKQSNESIEVLTETCMLN